MSWRDEADCAKMVAADPSLKTAWDNVNTDGWNYGPDPKENTARLICQTCPSKDSCFRDAVEDEEGADGIRAGFRFHNGSVNSKEALKIRKEYGVRVRLLRRAPVRKETASDGQDQEV